MKTYRSEKLGFEIDLSEDWSPGRANPPFFFALLARLVGGWTPQVDVLFDRGREEMLNVVLETWNPEPPPEAVEHGFRLYAQRTGYTDVSCGRISVGGRWHAWARYRMAGNVWLKKYMIILGGKGYGITASCRVQELPVEREKEWDAIACSLRALTPANKSS